MKNDVIEFTKGLSEFCSAGIPLGKALLIMKKSSSLPKRVALGAGEIAESLSGGRSLSFALETSSALDFPDWYLSLVAISEENGRLCETLGYIAKMLSDARKAREKFLAALSYPIFVALLALGASVVLVNTLGNSFFSGEEAELYKIRAWKSVGLSGAFLVGFVLMIAAAFLRAAGRSRLCVALRAISFLAGCGVPLVQAIESAVPVICGEKRLCKAFSCICSQIRGGGTLSDVFAACLEDAGFSFAARIVSARLELCQATGKNDAFKIASDALEERREKIRAAFLAFEQPILMCACAIYLVMLLKDTIMPFVLGGTEIF